VLIEFNPTSSNRFDYVQPPDPNCNQSNSPAALVRLGKSKEYELICVIGPNLLFVDRQYYEAFHIPDNSLDILRDEGEVTHLFLGFDGSLIVDGPALLRWHGLPLRVNQPFPKRSDTNLRIMTDGAGSFSGSGRNSIDFTKEFTTRHYVPFIVISNQRFLKN
jgi:hypothetical protein